jgi:hypothetical protein
LKNDAVGHSNIFEDFACSSISECPALPFEDPIANSALLRQNSWLYATSFSRLLSLPTNSSHSPDRLRTALHEHSHCPTALTFLSWRCSFFTLHGTAAQHGYQTLTGSKRNPRRFLRQLFSHVYGFDSFEDAPAQGTPPRWFWLSSALFLFLGIIFLLCPSRGNRISGLSRSFPSF